MAINPNTELSNRHCLTVACSGSGKSQLVNQLIPSARVNQRLVFWDPDADYKADSHDTRAGFARALANAVKTNAKKFRIAYTGCKGVADFEWFCAVVWAALDGNKLLHVVIEELADVSPHAGEATENWGVLIRRGRKYGLILYPVTQRGAGISKTCYTQCNTKFVGQQSGSDIKKMAVHADVSENDIASLEPLEFWIKTLGAAPAEKKKIKYKKIN